MAKYKVVNPSKQTVLAWHADVAETSWARIKGLLGRSAEQFQPGEGLWIVPSQGVHTIGMRFPIDVVYLNSESRVIHLCHGLAPFRISALKLSACSVIELPAGTLQRSRTSAGDVLEISQVEADGEV